MRWFAHFSAATLYKLIQNITNIVVRSSTLVLWPFGHMCFDLVYFSQSLLILAAVKLGPCPFSCFERVMVDHNKTSLARTSLNTFHLF